MNLGRRILGRPALVEDPSPPSSRVAQVVLYAHGSAASLRAALPAALDSFSGPDVLVVHDGHDEGARDYLARAVAEHGCTVVQNLDVLGFPRSVAKVAELARAEYLAVVDSDVVVTEGGLRELVEELQAAVQADVALGLLDAQLARGLRASESDAELASLVGSMDPDVTAAAIESSPVAGSIPCVVPSFAGHPCFAARRTALASLVGARSEPVRVCVVPRCYGSYRGAGIAEAQRPLLEELDPLVVTAVVEQLRELPSGTSWMHGLLGTTVLFLLPSPGAGGGAHSVVQEVVALRRLGLDARIANHASNRRSFEHSYPESAAFCSFYADEDELLDVARDATIVVATNFASVSSLERIATQAPGVVPLYYVQDYEPWFYAAHDPRHRAAKASYTLVPQARAFAKTDWLCRTVHELAGIEVARIEPSLDRRLHNGLHARPVSRPVPVTAMIRPSSARRNPRGTLSALRRVRHLHGNAVDVRVFGCSDDELDPLPEARGFRFVNWGELRRWEVAGVLRGAGIFVDLSGYQAFGSTGLEAMAAGCATVLPRGSGAEEYARDGENCLLVDTASEEEAVTAIDRLVIDAELRERIRREALRTARRYSARKCAWSLSHLFAERLGLVTASPSDRGVRVAG